MQKRLNGSLLEHAKQEQAQQIAANCKNFKEYSLEHADRASLPLPLPGGGRNGIQAPSLSCNNSCLNDSLSKGAAEKQELGAVHYDDYKNQADNQWKSKYYQLKEKHDVVLAKNQYLNKENALLLDKIQKLTLQVE